MTATTKSPEKTATTSAPLVSVVLSVLNGQDYLLAALQSIFNQTFGNFELIVINDGSTDSTAAILASQIDPRLRVIHNPQCLGLGPSFNKGILAARGTFIARHDADDLCHPDRFAKQVEFLERHPQVAMVGSSATIIDLGGRAKGVWTTPAREIAIKWQLLWENPFIHGSVMMRKSALEAVGIYSPVSWVEDYELWGRICDRFPVANLEEPLVSWREHPGSFTDVNRVIQRKQLREVAAARSRSLIPERFNQEDWEFIKMLFFSPANSSVDINRDQLRRAMSMLGRVQDAFYARYSFSWTEIAFHRKKLLRTWARHLLALAIRRNGNRNPACRVSLAGFAAKLWMKSFSQG